MENGLTSQFTNSVTSSPRGLRATLRIAPKSTFIIMGTIISQISTAMGTLTWLPRPNSMPAQPLHQTAVQFSRARARPPCTARPTASDSVRKGSAVSSWRLEPELRRLPYQTFHFGPSCQVSGRVREIGPHCCPISSISLLMASRSRLASGRQRNRADSAVQHQKRIAESRCISSAVPCTAAGSGTPQCAVMGCPGHTGQTSFAALSQTVKTKSSGGAPGCANSSQLLLRGPLAGMWASSS